MKKEPFLTVLILTLFAVSSVSCSSVGPRKYVFFGDPQPERVEMFEDYWSDFPFKPDDPNLPLRRGKGGVVRFFKKDSYSRSIMVDGDLTVNVYYSSQEGVSLREPDSQLVVTSKELNEKHRKFDKDAGYSYHVYLDLGLYDQPEEEITILSVFKDAKTGQTTLSKEIHTTAMGSSPLRQNAQDDEDEIENWTRKRLEKIRKGRYANDDENDEEESENDEDYEEEDYEEDEPTAKTSKRRRTDVDKKKSRLRDTIDLTDSQFEDIDGEEGSIDSVSYMESVVSKRNAALLDSLEKNREKLDYYRDKKRRELDEIEREYEDYENGDTISPVKKGVRSARSTKSNVRSSSRYVDMQSDLTDRFVEASSKLSSGFEEKYEQEAKKRNRTLRKTPPKAIGYADDEEEFEEELDDEYSDEDEDEDEYEYEERLPARRSVKSTKRQARVDDEEYYDVEPSYYEDEQTEEEREERTPDVKKSSAGRTKRATTGFYEVRPSSVSYETPRRTPQKAIDSSPYVYNDEEYEPVSVWSTRVGAEERASEFDRLDDFQPDDEAPQTEVYVKKKSTKR